ncbi:MAG: ThuA domain-containing protein [Gammaproteobacteria bacterium]|nr:ThuA domain-containing protein [Gammaproteobacteria bacterium]
MAKVSVLLVTKGHAFNHDAFLEMFEGDDGLDVTMVEQPAAQVLLRPENVGAYDAVLFYDMSGIPNVGLLHDGANDTGVPPDDYRRSIEALLERGTGIVLLNHGTVSWPEWPLWRQIHGSSFMLSEGDLDGARVPGSGYRGGHGPHPNPTFKLTPEDSSHPVVAGLGDGFTVTDEIYLKTPGFESSVTPLMRSDYQFVAENFTPPPMASPEEQASWDHPRGSNVLVWANAAGNSPVVASDIGDSPAAFANPDFRRLLHNALVWVASEGARAWAGNP